MTRMVRKQVYIERRQEEALKEMSRSTGLTEAELIRQGIDGLFAQGAMRARRLEAWERVKSHAEESMRKGPIEGKGRSWSREDLYDE